MEFKERITNEQIRVKFKSQFDLVRYAIRLAENMILTGRESRVKSDTKNRAMQILEEIALGKDQFDDIPVKQESETSDFRQNKPEGYRNERGSGVDRRDVHKKVMSDVKGSSQKKGRKILAG